MKKIIYILLAVMLLAPMASSASGAKATLYNPENGLRKAVAIGQPGVFTGGWRLETPTDSINYWAERLASGSSFTQEELDYLPYKVIYDVTPVVYRIIDRDNELGSTFIVPEIICRGDECKMFEDFDSPIGANPITRYRTTLASSMTSSQATVPASIMTTHDGDTITMAMLGGEVFLSIEPGASKEEIARCTGISGTTFTSCTRGLAFSGDSTASVSANRKTHNAGSVLIMSNVHYVYNTDTKENTWSVVQSFSIYPESTVGLDATTTEQFITFGQVNNIAIQGSATSTETNAGISELATRVENASSTPFGLADPHVQQSEHSTSTPSATITTDGVVWDIWTENDGKMNQDFLDLTEDFDLTGQFSVVKAGSGTENVVILADAYTHYLGGTGSFNIGWSATTLGVATSTLNVTNPDSDAALFVTGNATTTGTMAMNELSFGSEDRITTFSDIATTTLGTINETNDTTAEQTMFSETIDGGRIGENGALKLTFGWSNSDSGGTGGSVAITWDIQYGSTTYFTKAISATDASTMAGTAEFILFNNHSQAIQDSRTFMLSDVDDASSKTMYHDNTTTGTEDSSGDLDLKITVTAASQTNPDVTMSIYNVLAEYIK